MVTLSQRSSTMKISWVLSVGIVCFARISAVKINFGNSFNLCKNNLGDVGHCVPKHVCSTSVGLNIGRCPLFGGALASIPGVCCYQPKCLRNAKQELQEIQQRLSRKRRSTMNDGGGFLPAKLDTSCGIRMSDESVADHRHQRGWPSSVNSGFWREQQLINGVEVHEGSHKYPWMMALWLRFTRISVPTCGAALISIRHVITAAHCVADSKLTYILRGGSVINKIPTMEEMLEFDNEDDHGGVVMEISRIDVHPLFNPFSFENDIAVLTLTEQIRPSRDLFPVCLPPPASPKNSVNNHEGLDAIVTGWGCEVENCTLVPLKLHETTMEVIPNDLAMCWFANDTDHGQGRLEYIPSKLFIVGGDHSGSTSTCRGDSGSPVVRPINKMVSSASSSSENMSSSTRGDPLRFEVIGLVSWSKGCGRPFRPSVWTRVETYVSWIMEKMRQEDFE